jgi:hypothetical protein
VNLEGGPRGEAEKDDDTETGHGATMAGAGM